MNGHQEDLASLRGSLAPALLDSCQHVALNSWQPWPTSAGPGPPIRVLYAFHLPRGGPAGKH